ncbi:MAG: N-acetylmuramoyl-L-alanine amidase [Candidatus Rokuibacteriota bacterium]
MRPARLLLVITFVVLTAAAAGAGLPAITHEGRPYVELFRIAESLRGRLETTESAGAQLTTPGHIVSFARNSRRVIVDGKPVVLDAPVRVRGRVWLVPETFVRKILPTLEATPLPPLATAVAARGLDVTLEEVRIRSYPTFTRVVLETSGPVTYRVEATGPREARVRVVGLRAAPRTEQVSDGFIEEARLERVGDDLVLRVTFTGAPGEAKTLTLADPPRLVFDFNRPGDGAETAPRAAVGPLSTIVLDAGHGGHDTGAVGPTGLQEKDLVLDVTRRVARLLEERLEVKVLLTRDADHFVPLRDRTSFANKHRADLFVSIHGNAHSRSASSGVETFFLSSEATDNEARQLAAAENAVIQLESPAQRARAEVVRTILWDLAQSEFQIESSRLAEIMQDAMTQSLKIPNRGVKQAGFYVLGGAAMPAILIEVGFVTNPREERRFKDSRYRDEIARAIFTGLSEYKRYYDQRMRTALDGGR